MSDLRVAVVGGGIIGLASAFELLRLGVSDVTVLEERHPGEGSSGRSVGMVETQYLDAAAIETRVFGHRWFSALQREHGLGFVRGGYLRLAHDQADLERFAASVALQAELGIDDAQLLDPGEIVARWPQLVMADRVGGLYGPSDGTIDGYDCCALLVRLVRELGGNVVSGAAVRAAEVTPAGGRVLVTDTARVHADAVINAAGGWAGRVGQLLDAPVPLTPQLHGAVTIELGQPMTPPLPFVMDYVPGSGTDGLYFRSERADQLIAGLHTDESIKPEVSPDAPLGRVPEDFIERLTGLMTRRIADCDDMGVGRSWTGIYPMSPDHQPIVGPHPDASDVICALGAGGSGIQLAPAMARMAAEALVHGQSRTFLSPGLDWSPDRLLKP